MLHFQMTSTAVTPTHKNRIILTFISALYAIVYYLLYTKYVPHIREYEFVLILLTVLIAVLASASIRLGTFAMILLIPIAGSLPNFFKLWVGNTVSFQLDSDHS